MKTDLVYTVRIYINSGTGKGFEASVSIRRLSAHNPKLPDAELIRRQRYYPKISRASLRRLTRLIEGDRFKITRLLTGLSEHPSRDTIMIVAVSPRADYYRTRFEHVNTTGFFKSVSHISGLPFTLQAFDFLNNENEVSHLVDQMLNIKAFQEKFARFNSNCSAVYRRISAV